MTIKHPDIAHHRSHDGPGTQTAVYKLDGSDSTNTMGQSGEVEGHVGRNW